VRERWRDRATWSETPGAEKEGVAFVT